MYLVKVRVTGKYALVLTKEQIMKVFNVLFSVLFITSSAHALSISGHVPVRVKKATVSITLTAKTSIPYKCGHYTFLAWPADWGGETRGWHAKEKKVQGTVDVASDGTFHVNVDLKKLENSICLYRANYMTINFFDEQNPDKPFDVSFFHKKTSQKAYVVRMNDDSLSRILSANLRNKSKLELFVKE